YLPLKVIKERLVQSDAGAEGDGVDLEGQADREGASVSEELAEAPTGLQMSLEEMSAATGVDRERIKELESFGIVCTHGPEGGRYYDGEDYIVLSIVKDFLRHGIEPRHLTMYKHFADRESRRTAASLPARDRWRPRLIPPSPRRSAYGPRSWPN